MESAGLHFLAKNEGYGALIFFIIWALIAVVSQIQKWQEAQRKRRQSSPPPPPPPLPAERQVILRPQRPQQQKPRPLPKVLPRKMPKAPPPLPKPATRPTPVVVDTAPDAYEGTARATELGQRMTHTVGSEQAAAARAAQERPAISAAELSRAMRPQMLRRSFILTELLAPPLGLRDLQSSQERGPHERAQRSA